MEERISLPELRRTGFRTQIAIRAVGSLALKPGSQVKGAYIVTTPTVGAGFIRIGKLHKTRVVGLQQHLD